MRKVPPLLSEHLNQDVTSLACCWLMQLIDGRIFAFTDAQHDLTIDNGYLFSQ